MKNKKTLISIIIIILSIILIITGYVLLKSEQNNKKPVEEKQSELAKEAEEQSEILDRIYLLQLNMAQDYPIDDFQNIDDSKKTKFILDSLSKVNNEITTEEVIEEAKKYFEEFNIVKKEIKENNKLIYSYKDEKYKKETYEGSRCTIRTSIETKEKDNDKFIVKTKYYYLSGTKATAEDLLVKVNAYATLNDCEANTNELFTTTNNQIAISDSEYSLIKDKLNTYTYNISSSYKIMSIKE